MRNTDSLGNVYGILLDRPTYYAYINCGRRNAEKIAEAAGAVRKIGRSVRYYRPAIDAYLANAENQLH